MEKKKCSGEMVDPISLHADITKEVLTKLEYKIKHFPLKRCFDVVFSLMILILGLPFFIMISLVVRLSSSGPIIFGHERIGRGGIKFQCYKFRTMYPDAEDRLNDLLKLDHQKKLEWEKSYKLKNDPRITNIGKWLRKTSLDELPQFWNVLKGDLSVVGPRPVVQAELVKYYGCKTAKILSMRPGLTGLWQISGRNDINYEHRVFLDEKYIDQNSFLSDLLIVMKTLPAMAFSKGAY